jgi:ADP-ribose pyrophosphatase YjhB (NUDIX family)
MHIYPKGIEVAIGVIVINNNNNKIFLTRSKYWSNKYVLPGGNILPGENILKATERQIKDELGLDVQAMNCFNSGELINSKDFKRPAHYIYFNVTAEVINGQLKLNNTKHFDYKWVNPKDALKLDLAETFDLSIKKYIELLNNSKSLT